MWLAGDLAHLHILLDLSGPWAQTAHADTGIFMYCTIVLLQYYTSGRCQHSYRFANAATFCHHTQQYWTLQHTYPRSVDCCHLEQINTHQYLYVSQCVSVLVCITVCTNTGMYHSVYQYWCVSQYVTTVVCPMPSLSGAWQHSRCICLFCFSEMCM